MKYIAILLLMTIVSCKKYLDKISDKSLAVPTTIQEFQQILEQPVFFTSAPCLRDLGSDEYYYAYSTWNTKNQLFKNCYVWESNNYLNATRYEDWNEPYKAIYSANIVIDGIKSIPITTENSNLYNQVKGSALFYRAFYHFNVEETFGQPFSPSTADNSLGIPLKISPDLDASVTRNSVREVYDQIIADLNAAKDLLPTTLNLSNRNRPSRPTVFALLSRVYLAIQDYDKVLISADSCLNLYNTLIHYKDVPATNNPFVGVIPNVSSSALANDEVLFQCRQVDAGLVAGTTLIDSVLYKSYDNNDLRKLIYYRLVSNIPTPKGTYNSSTFLFAGLATDEVYLNKAECQARAGLTGDAMATVKILLMKRWNPLVAFPNFNATTPDEALDFILKERRKELVLRGIRWIDLRRLNQDPSRQVLLKRILTPPLPATVLEYVLPPKDKRYAFLVPPTEIALSGIVQTPR